MRVYTYSILSNTGGWGGCHKYIEGYNFNPVLAMVRGFEMVKKQYPDENCREKWEFGNYRLLDEKQKDYAYIHNTTISGIEISVFIEKIEIEDTPDNLEELVNSSLLKQNMY